MLNQTNQQTQAQDFRIGIYVHPTSPASSVVGPWDILTLAASQLQQLSRLATIAKHQPRHSLSVSLVSLSKIDVESPTSPIQILPHGQIGEDDFDLIIITALGQVPRKGFDFDHALVEWLQTSHNKGTAIASICSGAFLLAETGLLKHRRATTHWATAAQFRSTYPGVELQIDSMITHDGPFFCSGGAYAYQDLCLYLLEYFFSSALADSCSKLLLIDRAQRTQLMYAGVQGLKQHQDKLILEIQNWMESHLAQASSIEAIAKHFNMSNRNLVRRFKAATNEAPSHYLQKLRVERSKHYLQSSNKSIDDICESVGYQDAQYFRTLFKRLCGMTPSQYRSSKKS